MLRRSALSLLLAFTAWADRPRVVVVKSAPLNAYAQVVAGFAAEVKGQVEELVLAEGAEAQGTQFKKIAQSTPSLVLAIGPAAAVGARRGLREVPVLFTMVPSYEKYELDGPNTTGIALTSDLSLELTAIKTILPRVKRIGVVHDARFSKPFLDAAAQAATSRGMVLVPLDIDAPGKLERVLAAARGHVDALVIISDKTVGNAAVVERLISWSLEEKLPAIGIAAAQVKQGALFSLSPAPLSMGQQAGRVANRILVEKVDPGAMAVAAPEGLELTFNLTTAKKLGAADAFALEIVTFAARQGLTVKVAE